MHGEWGGLATFKVARPAKIKSPKLLQIEFQKSRNDSFKCQCSKMKAQEVEFSEMSQGKNQDEFPLRWVLKKSLASLESCREIGQGPVNAGRNIVSWPQWPNAAKNVQALPPFKGVKI